MLLKTLISQPIVRQILIEFNTSYLHIPDVSITYLLTKKTQLCMLGALC